MSIATPVLVNAFLGINTHPSDSENGKIKYKGRNAVRDAILAGEKEIRATTHLVSEKVDEGRILMISPPSPINLGENWDASNPKIVEAVRKENQERLKQVGDQAILPRTLFYLALGRYQQDAQGNLYFDHKSIPNGLRD
jgi:folate-dependent phosphoribosylglycinamide formyltransferase PurN